jgi:hypothetical protein
MLVINWKCYVLILQTTIYSIHHGIIFNWVGYCSFYDCISVLIGYLSRKKQMIKHGGLAERSNAAVLKTALREIVTGVRIPEPPHPMCYPELGRGFFKKDLAI